MDIDSEPSEGEAEEQMSAEGEMQTTTTTQTGQQSTPDQVEHICNELYAVLKKLPPPLSELRDGKSLLLEDWSRYKLEYYSQLMLLGTCTNHLLQIVTPWHFYWLSHYGRTQAPVLSLMKDQLGYDAKRIDTTYYQCRCILICAEEYLLLAHIHMPSWRILSQSKGGAGGAAAAMPMEVLFYYELCKIRAITSVFHNVKASFSLVGQENSSNSPELLTLKSLDIVPPNLGYWKYLVPGSTSTLSQNKLYVPFYTQTQLEDSFVFLFLKLNLISYHTDVWLYIQYLLYRLAWLCVGPHSDTTLDKKDGRCLVTTETKDNPEENFLCSTQSVYTYDYKDFKLDASKHVWMCNRDYIYRAILRYHELLLRISVRSFLDTTRLKALDPVVEEFSIWWQKCLKNKIDAIFHMMQTEMSKEYFKLLLPPSDIEWVKYKYPLQWVGEVSLWTILYPDLKVLMLETSNKDIRQIYDRPGQGEMIIFELIILSLMNKLFADKFTPSSFEKEFVRYQEDAIASIQEIKTNRKMPLLIQTFNRFAVFYRGQLSEYPNIFGCLATLFIILVQDFPHESVTQASVFVINQQKKELDSKIHRAAKKVSADDKQREMDVGVSKQKTSGSGAGGLADFTTLQTRRMDNDDDNDYVNGVKVAQNMF